MRKIIKGDTVMAKSGKDVGKSGRVERVMAKGEKLVVAGVNIYKKHGRPTKKNPKGGIIDVSMPMQMSNLMLICPSCSKPTRVGFNIVKNRKFRVCKKCKTEVQSKK